VVEGVGLVPWLGDPPDASFGFYIREAFQRRKGYYTTRVVRHWCVIATEEQQLHEILY